MRLSRVTLSRRICSEVVLDANPVHVLLRALDAALDARGVRVVPVQPEALRGAREAAVELAGVCGQRAALAQDAAVQRARVLLGLGERHGHCGGDRERLRGAGESGNERHPTPASAKDTAARRTPAAGSRYCGLADPPTRPHCAAWRWRRARLCVRGRSLTPSTS